MAKQTHHFDESVEMYLKTIAELSVMMDPVPVTQLARKLGISTVSASEMVHRLEEQSLLHHTPYKGVRMTEQGLREANAVIRRHQLWEVFLYEKLGLSWSAVHDLACQLEHIPSPVLVEALNDYLGNPERCPHGNMIPQPGAVDRKSIGAPLNQFPSNSTISIVGIPLEESELLQALEAAGIGPGVEVQVMIHAEQGDIEVHHAGKSVSIPAALAKAILAVER